MRNSDWKLTSAKRHLQNTFKTWGEIESQQLQNSTCKGQLQEIDVKQKMLKKNVTNTLRNPPAPRAAQKNIKGSVKEEHPGEGSRSPTPRDHRDCSRYDCGPLAIIEDKNKTDTTVKHKNKTSRTIENKKHYKTYVDVKATQGKPQSLTTFYTKHRLPGRS